MKICLAMQGTWVQSFQSGKIPHAAEQFIKPSATTSLSLQATTTEARLPQIEPMLHHKRNHTRSLNPQLLESRPHLPNQKGTSRSKEDPVQPKI